MQNAEWSLIFMQGKGGGGSCEFMQEKRWQIFLIKQEYL